MDEIPFLISTLSKRYFPPLDSIRLEEKASLPIIAYKNKVFKIKTPNSCLMTHFNQK